MAEAAILRDTVFSGRFLLGVGRGGPWIDLEVFGTGLARYETGFAEALDLLLHTLTEPIMPADGPTFRFRAVPVIPPPVRQVPVWVAATSLPTVALAAHRRLPVMLGMHEDTTAQADLHAAYGQVNPDRVPHAATYLASSAAERLRATLTGWLRRTTEDQRVGPAPSASHDITAYVHPTRGSMGIAHLRTVWADDRHVTRRGVLWLGLTCDVRCNFCWGELVASRDKAWMPLAEVTAAGAA